MESLHVADHDAPKPPTDLVSTNAPRLKRPTPGRLSTTINAAAAGGHTPPNEPISAIPRPEWRSGPPAAGASARRRSRSLVARETADIVGHVKCHDACLHLF